MAPGYPGIHALCLAGAVNDAGLPLKEDASSPTLC